jgi:hypothetical protein
VRRAFAGGVVEVDVGTTMVKAAIDNSPVHYSPHGVDFGRPLADPIASILGALPDAVRRCARQADELYVSTVARCLLSRTSSRTWSLVSSHLIDGVASLPQESSTRWQTIVAGARRHLGGGSQAVDTLERVLFRVLRQADTVTRLSVTSRSELGLPHSDSTDVQIEHADAEIQTTTTDTAAMLWASGARRRGDRVLYLGSFHCLAELTSDLDDVRGVFDTQRWTAPYYAWLYSRRIGDSAGTPMIPSWKDEVDTTLDHLNSLKPGAGQTFARGGTFRADGARARVARKVTLAPVPQYMEIGAAGAVGAGL